MIHSGAIVGAGVPQFRSMFFKLINFPYPYFRSDREKRDFVSSGAAAGVAGIYMYTHDVHVHTSCTSCTCTCTSFSVLHFPFHSCLWSSHWWSAVQSGGGVLVLEPGPHMENGMGTLLHNVAFIPFNSKFNFTPCRLHPTSNGNSISESHPECEGHAHHYVIT